MFKGNFGKKSREELIGKFTVKERFLNGKYTAKNGPGAAVRKSKKSHPHLKFGESQARAIRKKYPGQKKRGQMSIKKLVP